MDLASSDVLVVLNYLLPGLVATWIFRRLTPHDKPKDLEAITEALLFTAAVQPILLVVEGGSTWVGVHLFSIGPWTDKGAFVLSVILGLAVGSVAGTAANHDVVHRYLRRFKLTKQTSFPSEWYRQQFCEERWMILTMRNGDRLRGWPREFPNSPDRGHFSLRHAAWLLTNGDLRPLEFTECILVPAAEVLYLEVLQFPSEYKSEQQESAASEGTNS